MAGTLELEQGVPFPHVRLQIFGRGGVGKSSTINAMCGKPMEVDLASTAGAQLPLLQIRRQTLAVGCDASVLCKYDPEPGTKEESLALAAHAAAVLQGAPQVTGQSMLAKAAAPEEEAAQEAAQVVEVAETSKTAKAVQAEELAAAKAPPAEARAPQAAAAPEPTAAPSTSGKSDSTPASPPLRPPMSARTAKAAPAQAPPRVVDPKMVIEYREGKRKQELVLHVQDSGGQSRFHSLLDLLHAGQACIGAVCFSLPELCDDETQVECVDELRLQLDTFASRGSATPLLLVGTHKGEVPGGLEVQKELSALLDRELNGCKVLEQLVRDVKEMKSDMKEVKLDVKVVLQHSAAHFKMLSTLLMGAEELAPKLICFLPMQYKKQGKLRDWLHSLKRPKDWFSQHVRIFFIDPISLTLANTNGGNGFELEFPKEWVAKALPYVKLGLTVLKVAAGAGKLAGFPVIPDLKAVMGEWLDSQLAVVGELRSFGLDKIEEMTGDRQSAEELLGKVDAQCSEMLKGKLEEACAFADSTLLSEKLKEPLKKSLKELDNLLCGKYPSWKDECGLVRTQANDGSVEWVLPEHVQKYKEMGELLMKAKDA